MRILKFLKKIYSYIIIEIYLSTSLKDLKYPIKEKFKIKQSFRLFGHEYIQSEDYVLTLYKAKKILGTPESLAETYQVYRTKSDKRLYEKERRVKKLIVAGLLFVLMAFLIFVIADYFSDRNYKFKIDTTIVSSSPAEVYQQ